MRNTDTKTRILTEALRLFAVGGYEAVTVEQISTAVGIKSPIALQALQEQAGYL